MAIPVGSLHDSCRGVNTQSVVYSSIMRYFMQFVAFRPYPPNRIETTNTTSYQGYIAKPAFTAPRKHENRSTEEYCSFQNSASRSYSGH